MKELLEALTTARAEAFNAHEPDRNTRLNKLLDDIDNLLAVAVRLAYDAQKEGTP